MQRKWRRDWERSKPNQVTSRITKSISTVNPLKRLAKSILPPLAAASILLAGMTSGYANPTAGQVTTGTGTIAESGNTMTITQTTDKLGINWQSFSIASGETVNFIQPGSSSIALNRVVGNNASSIYGALNANGQVFLINPNGVLFAPGAQVNVGGIVASTLNISDHDFQSGNYTFSGSGGPVTNEGTITTADGGYAVLLGSRVTNDGVIVAQQGTVALAAGDAVTIDFDGDGLLNLAVDAAAVNASVANHNLIQADGGTVIMTAQSADDLAGTVVNNSGVVQAKTVNNVNGTIRLDGGSKGAVVNSGTLDASGRNSGETGGTVKVLGDKVTLADEAKIDVSGDRGGGTALIGGNAQEKETEQNAATTTVAANTTINADALTSGNGGKVVIWADDTTTYNGTISAKGGAVSGDGGSAEVSGKNKLFYTGTTDLQATNGTTGTLLLDPSDYTIAETGGDITPEALATALDSANITILSSDGTVNTNGNGDINVNSAVTWTSSNTLTLSAYRDVNANANISNTGGGSLVLRADNTGAGTSVLGTGHGTVSFGSGATVSLDSGTTSIYYDPTSYTDSATKSITTNSWDSTNQKLKTNSTSNPYKSYVTGNLTAYMLVNTLADLQNITTNLTGVYALSKDIDVSATSGWNSGQGFTPIGTGSGSKAFKGLFDGDGHVINGLYINSSSNYTGLFGYTNYADIRNVSLENVDITSNGMLVNGYSVGSLIGNANYSTITNCYATGTVTGNVNATLGGLIGYQSRGTITDSYTMVTVTGNDLGNGGSNVGGLVGYSSNGFITNCYSTGAVTVSYPLSGATVGGLVGANGSTITNCYSTGAVTLTNLENPSNVSNVGGLVGWTSKPITNSYTTSRVTVNGDDVYIGGLAGRNLGSKITNSYSAGLITNNGSGNTVGGFIGYVSSGTMTDCYWDVQTSGISDTTQGAGNVASASGVTGLTTADLLNHTKYAGTWDFTNTWYMIDGYTRPFLRSEYSTTITNGHQLQLMAMDLTADYTLGRNIDMSGYAMVPLSGFVPIGSATAPFTGTLDGNGYAVNGLTIANSASSAIGLFGYTSGAIISSIGLLNVDITGGDSNAYVGSLTGYSDVGSITNVYSTGEVSGTTTVGGLVGLNTGNITNVYSASKVISTKIAGGLAGTNTGNITTSYSTGAVSGTGTGSKAGGLVGQNTGGITNTYSAGAVTSTGGTAGGLVGYNDGGTITASVWATDIAGQAATTGVGNDPAAGGVTGLTTAKMMNHTNYDSNWDFTNTWFTIDGATLPFLRSEYSTTITNAHQLQLIAMNLDASYTLGSNIDLGGYKMGSGAFVLLGSAANPFTGSLQGGGYTINGLTIANSGSVALGLFSYTQGATISNVKLANVNITAGVDNLYVGSLVGYSGNGTSIANCSSAGIITAGGAGSNIGGLVGYNAGSIESSVNTATIIATGTGSNIGGLVGMNDSSGSIDDSYNDGTVTASGAASTIGGLVGTNNGSIASSYNDTDGTVTSEASNNSIGGLVGKNDGNISESYNDGAVKTTSTAANNYVGGLVGKNNNLITTSYNTGALKVAGANSIAGGMAGLNDGGGSITNAYSMSVLTSTGADNTVGGLAGINDGSIAYAYSTGAITANGTSSTAGGVAGANNGMLANVYWDTGTTGQVSGAGSGSTAGAQKMTTADLMDSISYTGWDADTWGIVNGISLPYLKWQYSSTPKIVSGLVEAGGAGKTVDLINYSTLMGQTTTIGANGFYYMVLPASSSLSSNSVILLYVAGDSDYKANSVYYFGSNGLAGADLVKGTLIIDGGSSSMAYYTFVYAANKLTTDDIIYSWGTPSANYDSSYLIVNGNLRATNYSLLSGDSIKASGSITINSNYNVLMNADSQKLSGYADASAQIIAGGDLTIITSGNFIIRPGLTTSTELSAGGDITIVTGGQFINYSGAEAIVCGGRWLIYTTDPVIYPTNTSLYYSARFPWAGGWAMQSRFVYNDEDVYAVRDGLTSDFVRWNTSYGDAVPATGNGFIYTTANTFSPQMTLSPHQLMRQEAVNEVHSNARRWETLASPVVAMDWSAETLPMLTISGDGVAFDSGLADRTAEQKTNPEKSNPSGTTADISDSN